MWEIFKKEVEQLLIKIKNGDIIVGAIVYHDGTNVNMCSAGPMDHAAGLLSTAAHRCAIDCAIKLGEK